MFIGEFISSFGDKNRIALPKKLREQLKGSLIATRGYENCTILLDSERWEKLVSEINKKSLLSLDVRDTKRFLVGGAHELELDTQGRFVLPESLKAFSFIESKVTFLGVGEWIEMWDTDRWNKKLTDLSAKVADIAERL